MKRIALVFPGQGSQYVGMGSNLYSEFSLAREVFEEANHVLGFDIKKLCFEGNLKALSRTENAQPAILTVSTASFRVIMNRFDINLSCMAGHSLGEISALSCAGAISFADALRIARQRGLFMSESMGNEEGAMIAVTGVGADVVDSYCKNVSTSSEPVVISNYNAPSQTVISGHKEAALRLEKEMEKIGARTKMLNTVVPFHCPLMKTAAEKLKDELKKYTYFPLKYKVLSNVTGKPYGSESEIVENLFAQVTAPVLWRGCMEYLEQSGINVLLDLGPDHILRNLTKKNSTSIVAYSADEDSDFTALKDELCGNYSLFLDRALATAVSCPNRNWNNDEYQQGVIVPFRKVKDLSQNLENQGKYPSLKHVKEAMDMLKSVFLTKKLPLEEQNERIHELINETNMAEVFV